LTVSSERHEWIARKRERAAYRGESPGSLESHAYWQVLERNVLYLLHNCAGIVRWLDAHAESIDSQGFRIAIEEAQARSREIVELAAQGDRGAASAQLGALREAWDRLQRCRETGDAALYEKLLEEVYVWSACAQGLVQNTSKALARGITPDAVALGQLVQSWLSVEPDGMSPTSGGSGAPDSQVMRDLGALLQRKPNT
jgi:hypothetical protein